MAREAPEFYLSNGAETPPTIHSILSQSTNTWQYVVADPSTSHCVIIDPVRDASTDPAVISTTAADAVVDLVKKHGYFVDHVLETHASSTCPQTAAWSLRMQLSDLQGSPPQVYSDGTVSAMRTLWQRRYGSSVNFTTKLGQGLADGECLKVGRMRIHCLHLSSFAAPDCRAFLVGGNLFGAYGIGLLPKENCAGTLPANQFDDETYTKVWTAMRRVLSLPEETQVYATDAASGKNVESEVPLTVRQCRFANTYVDLSAPEFAIRREGERRALLQHSKSPGMGSHRLGSRSSDIPLVPVRK